MDAEIYNIKDYKRKPKEDKVKPKDALFCPFCFTDVFHVQFVNKKYQASCSLCLKKFSISPS